MDESEKAQFSMGGNMASRGFGGSGVRSKSKNDILTGEERGREQLNMTLGAGRSAQINEGMSQIANQFTHQRKELDRIARNAHRDKIKAKEVKHGDKGFYKDGGNWYHRNQFGVETSIGNKVSRKGTPALWRHLNKDKVAAYKKKMRDKK